MCGYFISFDLNKTTFISTHACVRVCAHIWTHIHVPQPVYGGQRTNVGSLCVGPGDGTQLTGAVNISPVLCGYFKCCPTDILVHVFSLE